jgi:hypothetical protein
MFETYTSESVMPTSNRWKLPQSDQASTDNGMLPFASLDLSRPITVYDSSIDPTDLHILQNAFQAFTDRSCKYLMRRLIPKFALVYGTSISHPSLRHAIVLYSRTVLPQIRFSSPHEKAQQRRRTRQALGRRLKRPDVLDEGDLFAAYFVAAHFGFYTADYDEQLPVYAKGCLAVARHMFDAANRSLTKNSFQIFWGMLIWDLSGWARLDGSRLIPQGFLGLVFGPSQYGEWCRILDLRLSSLEPKPFCFDLSDAYFVALTRFYTETRMFEEDDLRTIKEAKAYLTNADEPRGYWSFELHLGRSQSLRTTINWFKDLLYYNWCCLLISLFPPSSDKLNFRIVVETRVFTFFGRIENAVDRLEASLVNEEEVVALIGPDSMQESDDPLLVQSKFPSTLHTNTVFSSPATLPRTMV